MTHVPYSGAAPALKDLLGGQVKVAMLNLGATKVFIEQGPPKGAPQAVVETLRKAVAEVNADPAYQKVLASQGAERMDLSPAQTTAFVQRDKVAMTKLLGTLGLLEK